MGACIVAVLRGDDSEEAEAGGLIVADALCDMRAMRQYLETIVKSLGMLR